MRQASFVSLKRGRFVNDEPQSCREKALSGFSRGKSRCLDLRLTGSGQAFRRLY